MNDVLRVDAATLVATEHRLARTSDDLTSAAEHVARAVEQALRGAGQFRDDLAPGTTAFAASWAAVLPIFSSSADAVGRLALNTLFETESLEQRLRRMFELRHW
ncbi:MAG TPA: hypothetical protein VGX28_08830 [Frankiaceae bacterium]|jgi:hypothetical protein|nr:hypothetical protein [Frankiaceae bacterium]